MVAATGRRVLRDTAPDEALPGWDVVALDGELVEDLREAVCAEPLCIGLEGL